MAMMENPGKAGLQGADFHYGSACPDPFCAQGHATPSVDATAATAFVTWTEDGGLFFLPSNGQPDHGWPQAALDAFALWPEM